ncbi:ribonuclease P protein subunit p40-like isoform X1 [Montipora foliosa]|uniref:ribonuclease P protein subunit p40-like isoform X1 n=1 Tax=Montipora foliosa TaxID=591990 RepID=UPI0035F1DE81
MADGKRFSTPKRRLRIEKSSFQDKKERHKKHIEDHPLNHAVQFVIPNSSLGSILQYFQGITPTQDHFLLIEIPVHTFTEPEFIKTFVKNGHFVALSWHTRIDSGTCVAVLPTGMLILSLDKDTYEQLGLTGKPSAFQKKQRFIVEVDLKAPYFVPGKKYYDRVKWCLKEKEPMTFKFIMSWTNEGHTSTDKLNSYFSSYSGQTLHNKEDIESDKKNEKAPIISFDRSVFTDENMPIGSSDVCSCLEFFEWLGCVACGIDCSEASPDNFVSRLSCPEPSQDLKKLITCRWTGLVMTSAILSMVHEARSQHLRPSDYHSFSVIIRHGIAFVDSKCNLNLRKLVQSGDIPWVAMTVWGFTDCPVTWKNNEHGHFLSGENFYTFVIFPDDNYWLYTALGSHDINPNPVRS